MQIKAILFDLFDTLLLIEGGESFYEPCLTKLYESLVKHDVNVAYEEFEQVYFKVRDKLYFEAAKNLEEPHFNVRISQTLKELGYNYDVSHPIVTEATETFANEFEQYVCLDEDAVHVLQELQKKYKLGLVSNFAIPECVWKLLEKFQLKTYFNVVIISGEINKRKPSREIFQKALNALAVNASETIFVGDTLNMDIKGAKTLGMKAVLIQRQTVTTDTPKSFIWKPPKEDEDLKPDITIKRLKELLIIINNF